MDQEKLLSELSTIRQGSTFITLLGYRNNNQELADYNIIFNINYRNALLRSISILSKIETSFDIEAQAKQQLMRELNNSLSKKSPHAIYTQVTGPNGQIISGIKKHHQTGVLYLSGLINSKRVIVPGTYSNRQRCGLAQTKEHFRKMLPISKIRQFTLTPQHLNTIAVQGKRLTLQS